MWSDARFRRVLIGVSAFLLILTALYNFFLYTPRVEHRLRSLIESSTKARVQFHMAQASLLSGFEMQNVVLETLDGAPILKADKIRFHIFLPSILIGHFGIRELGLYHPQIYLTGKNNQWNYQALLPEKTGKAAPEPEKPSTPLPPEISTFVPVKLYANIKIESLDFIYESVTPQGRQSIVVKNFSFRLAVITKTFRKIPLDLGALDLFDTLIVSLNPSGPMDIALSTGTELRGPLGLSWFLYRENGTGQTEFASRLQLDTKDLAGGRTGRMLLPLGIHFKYDIAYEAKADILHLRNIDVGQYGISWIRSRAEVRKATEPSRSLDFRILESRINLTALGAVLANISADPVVMDGELVLAPLSLKGDLSHLAVEGDIKADRAVFRAGRESHSLYDFALNVSGSLDLYAVLPFLERPADYKESTLAFGLFHELHIPRCRMIYNGASLNANVDILPGKGIHADVKIANLVIDPWGYGTTGVMTADMKVHSPESFKVMDIETVMTLRDMRWAMKRSRSHPVHLSLNTRSTMIMGSPFVMRMSRLHAELHTTAGELALSTDMTGEMRFGGGQWYDLMFERLNINYEKLHPTLPGELQYSMAGYRPYLSKGLQMRSKMYYSLVGTSQELRSESRMNIPFMGIEDLDMTADLDINDRGTQIHRVNFSGLRGTFRGQITGSFNKEGDKVVPIMDVQINMSQKDLIRVHENLAMQGLFHLNLKVRPDAVRGQMTMKDLNIEMTSGNCTVRNVPACKVFRIEEMNMDLPIVHDMNLKDPMQIVEQPIDNFADAIGDPNLKIRFIASSHNPAGAFDSDGYFYAGALPKDREPGLAARIDYRKNVFHISWLRMVSYRTRAKEGDALWVRDSTIDGRNSFFNLAVLDTRRMEYALRLQIKNLDLQPYIAGAKKGFDGIISADLDVTGRDLTEPIYNTTARLAVHRISPEFSGFAVRILTPDLIARGVRSILEIPSIRVELRGGLVYSYIGIKRGGVASLFIRPSGDEIAQERISLAQFLERTKKETAEMTAADRGGGK